MNIVLYCPCLSLLAVSILTADGGLMESGQSVMAAPGQRYFKPQILKYRF